MAVLKYYAAIQRALAEEMRRDPATILVGEDIAVAGGIYAQTRGLLEEFGPDRVIDAPAGEVGYLGACVGCALTGLRPIAEISFADFFPVCMDQIVNQAAKIRYMSGGQAEVPLTILAFGGGGVNAGPQHSSSHEAWLGSIPGLKVVMPATPSDVLGLVKSAIRDNDPVAVIFHKGLLQTKEEVEDGPGLTVPIGSAIVRRKGSDVTLVAWSGAVRKALAAADQLEAQGVQAEVIDLRSIQPLDLEAIADAVNRTGRLLIVQESVEFSGIGAEIAAQISRECFSALRAPIDRLAAPFTPVPYSVPLEQFHLPQVAGIVERAQELVAA